MNVLNIEHIHKIFGDKVIFDDASQSVHEGDKIGIIGINGTGKTTLLRILAGEEEPDDGQIVYRNGLKLAWLPQNPVFKKRTQFCPMPETERRNGKYKSYLNQAGH